MRFLVLLSWMALLSSKGSISAQHYDEDSSSGWKSIILQIQQQQDVPGIDKIDMDSLVAKEATFYRRKFRDLPYHAERLDDDTQKEIQPGALVWFLLEIPRAWVTATVLEVVAPPAEETTTTETTEMWIELTQNRGRYLGKRGKTIRAVREEDRVVFQAQNHRDRGVWEGDNGRYRNRRLLYEQAIELDPHNPVFYDNMGIYWMDNHHEVDEESNQNENFKEGLRWYQKSIEMEPIWYHTYYNLAIGLLYNNVGESRSDKYILQVFEDALERNPLYLDAIWRAADQSRKLGRYNEECYYWRVLRELNKNPSPNPDQDQWPPHNPVWEEWLPEQIKICMDHIKAESSNKSNDNEL